MGLKIEGRLLVWDLHESLIFVCFVFTGLLCLTKKMCACLLCFEDHSSCCFEHFILFVMHFLYWLPFFVPPFPPTPNSLAPHTPHPFHFSMPPPPPPFFLSFSLSFIFIFKSLVIMVYLLKHNLCGIQYMAMFSWWTVVARNSSLVTGTGWNSSLITWTGDEIPVWLHEQRMEFQFGYTNRGWNSSLVTRTEDGIPVWLQDQRMEFQFGYRIRGWNSSLVTGTEDGIPIWLCEQVITTLHLVEKEMFYVHFLCKWHLFYPIQELLYVGVVGFADQYCRIITSHHCTAVISFVLRSPVCFLFSPAKAKYSGHILAFLQMRFFFC